MAVVLNLGSYFGGVGVLEFDVKDLFGGVFNINIDGRLQMAYFAHSGPEMLICPGPV